MSDEEDDQEVAQFFIPGNFQSGINFAGLTFSGSRLIQAGVLAAIPFAIAFYVLPAMGFELDIAPTISATLVFAVALGYFGIFGINGDSLLGFLSNVMKFNKGKRTAYYNPRVKTEAVSYDYDSDEDKQLLPRDKVIAMYNKYRDAFDEKARQKAVDQQAEADAQNEVLFFEDDEGTVNKPIEYMTKKEYKAYLKEKKRALKEAKKEAKRRGKGR